jgi:hypothetical protein
VRLAPTRFSNRSVPAVNEAGNPTVMNEDRPSHTALVQDCSIQMFSSCHRMECTGSAVTLFLLRPWLEIGYGRFHPTWFTVIKHIVSYHFTDKQFCTWSSVVQYSTNQIRNVLRFKNLTKETMKTAVFWGITQHILRILEFYFLISITML